MEVMMVRKLRGLYPATEVDAEKVNSLPAGQPVKCKVTRARNLPFHRKFWALATLAKDHSEHMSVENLVDDLKIMVGHCDKIVRMDGSIWLRPKSISFGKMEQEEFDKFYDACCNALLRTVFKGMEQHELEEVVLDFM